MTPTITPQPTGITEYVGDSNTLTTTGTQHRRRHDLLSVVQQSDRLRIQRHVHGLGFGRADRDLYAAHDGRQYVLLLLRGDEYQERQRGDRQHDIVSVVVQANPVTPTIDPQPTGLTEYVGDSNTLTTAGHTTDGGAISYQWYSNPNDEPHNGTSLGSALGAQTAAKTPPTTAANTYYYYCTVKNTLNGKAATANTNIVTVVVQADPVQPTINPQPTGHNRIRRRLRHVNDDRAQHRRRRDLLSVVQQPQRHDL